MIKRRVCEVKQSSEKDCGPACLLSIIKYYKGFVNLETIKIDSKTTSRGTNAYDLIKAANKYGFDAAGYSVEVENLLTECRAYPFIAQVKINKFEHYIVVYEVQKNKVVVMDPAYGKKTLSIDDFIDMSTGVIIEFFPRSTITLLKKENSIFDMFIEILKLDKKLIVKLLKVSLLFTIFSVITTYYFQIAYNSMGYDLQNFKIVVSLFFLLYILKLLVFKLKIDYKVYINKNLLIRLYRQFFDHLFSIPSKNLENKSVGEIVTRAGDLANIRSAFVDILISVSLDSVLMIIAIPLLIIINVELFFILFTMLIFYFIIGFIYGKLLYKKLIYNKEYETSFNTNLIESITMLKNIKYLNKVNNSLKKLEYNICNYINSNFSIEKFYNQEFFLKTTVTELGYFFINSIGLYFVYKNKLDVVSLVTFNTLMGFFLEPIKNLINNIPKYYFVRASIYKLNEFMSLEKENSGEYEKLVHFDIKVKNISFSYNEFNVILKNINFEIMESEHVFLSGKSGGGKSTLCNLLLRNLYVDSGEILIGERNILDLSLNSLRDSIRYISQKEYLFSDTIKENILFFEEYNSSKFNKVCGICQIDSILKNKFLRYESLVEMEGANFSGGEKQRLVLARALMNEFNILIIDEALSEVDYETEIQIIKDLNNYYCDKIIIYVSHKNLESYFKKVIKIE